MSIGVMKSLEAWDTNKWDAGLARELAGILVGVVC